MEITQNIIKQAKEDLSYYDNYIIEMKNSYIKNKSFKQIFGYEILLFKNGGFKFNGKLFI